MRTPRINERVVYLDTLTCTVLRIFPEKGTALVKFSNSIDKVVPLNTLTPYTDTP